MCVTLDACALLFISSHRSHRIHHQSRSQETEASVEVAVYIYSDLCNKGGGPMNIKL